MQQLPFSRNKFKEKCIKMELNIQNDCKAYKQVINLISLKQTEH